MKRTLLIITLARVAISVTAAQRPNILWLIAEDMGPPQIALNNRWLEEQGVPDMNAPAAIAARKTCEA